MQINPPFGYSEIVPLRKDRKVRLPAPGALPDFCRRANAVPISYSEFGVASLREGGAMNLGGMHRVDERKLEFLNAAQHRNLIRKGVMGRIYAHLISLENFARLLTRKDAAGKPE
jgi:hypothetical protein